ncbi:hypothetical protein V496_02498 [Pseudogymnoascus sp. VKM F-4515 (FW-2607)]|nr:hypothetical protein V496_02498 [Pseudogymnoascus sp. VKM F-4515 (FW-2607)]KFY95623.1 hypothetical protein V498_03246 [Pseudogymnoascus sp. VKM F-4517 (FW-2822)]
MATPRASTNHAPHVDWLPITQTRSLRVLVFKSASPTGDESRPRPLHLDVHGGAFVGGLPESDAMFCARLARETGAVVISTTYRYAPKHTFPAAIDDVDATLVYLRQHAEERYNADPSLITVSGFSAGGNLALATALSAPAGVVKAAVTFYGAVDLRLSPAEKPKPTGFPATDPLVFLQPLFDSYAALSRAENMNNPRLSPIVADIKSLPENILMVVPGIDILAHEQITFIKRLNEEVAKDTKGHDRRFEMLYDDEGFHGYLEVPSSIVSEDKKNWAFGAGVKFITDAHQKCGWHWTSYNETNG